MATPQELLRKFKEMCYDLGGVPHEKHPKYTCIIKLPQGEVRMQLTFSILPYPSFRYLYYGLKNETFELRGFSFHETIEISKDGNSWRVYSTTETRAVISKDNIDDPILEFKVAEYDIGNKTITPTTIQQISLSELQRRVLPAKEFLSMFYIPDTYLGHYSKLSKYIHTDASVLAETPLYANILPYLASAKKKEVFYISSLDLLNTILGSLPNVLTAISIIAYVEEETLEKLKNKGWKIKLVPTNAMIAIEKRNLAVGITDSTNKEIMVSTSIKIPFNLKSLVSIIAHELHHALERIKGKPPSAWWSIKGEEYVPLGEEKEAEEVAQKIRKALGKYLKRLL